MKNPVAPGKATTGLKKAATKEDSNQKLSCYLSGKKDNFNTYLAYKDDII